MSFKASCPFCPTEIKLSTKALGESVCCPNCGNYFTAAPPETVSLPGAPSLRAVAARPVPPPRSTPLPATRTAPSPVEGPSAPMPAAPVSFIPRPEFSDSGDSPSTSSVPAWINGWGVAAFLLSSLGLFCASMPPYRYVTVHLAGLGLLVVMLGFLVSLGERKTKDTVWLCFSGLTGACVLGVAMFRPEMLNSRWGIDFAVPQKDPNRQILVSLDNHKVKKDLATADWVDAKDGAVRMRDLHIRVQSVKVGLPQMPETAKEKVKGERLLVAILIANSGHLHTARYEGQATRKHPAVLRDNRGRKYSPSDLGVKLAEQTNKAVLRPASHVEDLLVFDVPRDDLEYLELEIPASAWQSDGACHFRIPKAMITGRLAKASAP